MRYKKLGGSDVMTSEIILGCWSMGGDYFGAVEDSDSIAAVRTSLDMGVTTFDTAELYGNGRSEEVLGKALSGVDRDRYVLISKVWKTNMAKDKMPAALEGSMRRMGVEYIDVYFLHYPVDDVPIGQIMESITRLKEQGKIGAIGVSNFSVPQMEEAMRYGPIDVIQPCYSLLWRYIDRDLLPFCRERNIGVITYSSLAQGLLTDALTKDSVITDGRKNSALFQPGIYEACLKVRDAVSQIAKKRGKTTAQAAVNWICQTPGITAAIVGSANARRAAENVETVGWALTDAEYAAIDEASRAFTDTMPEFELFFSTEIKK